jgi:hypothetical protein
MSTARFPIRFTGVNKAMALLGMGPRVSYVDVGADAVEVRMGWAFRATIPVSSIRSAVEDGDRVLGWGVHGWRGTWLVNGSSGGLVRIELGLPVRAKVGFVPVRLAVLRVAVDDPAGLVAALAR